jgi:pimeloyl-ACP methyl ester carboxylesterase
MPTPSTHLRRALTVTGRRTAARPRRDPQAVPEPDGAPGRGTLTAEVTAVRELVRLLASSPRLARAPRGDGGPVIDIPGWRAPEVSGAPLRTYLRHLGHDAQGWGMGTNVGDPERDARLLAAQVRALAAEHGRPVALVGWSLGGVIAREVAREHPAAVRRVITYGTPVGGPAHTIGEASWDTAAIERVSAMVRHRDTTRPIRVPITAILTRRDGIVAWQACVDRFSPDVEHVEVASTHLGLGIDPDVWRIVADRLAPGR